MAGWLNEVVGGLAKGVDSAKEGSKLFVEKAKINTQIQDAEKEKNRIIMNMGNLVYNLQSSGEISIAQCVSICESITQINQHIAALQGQLKSLEAPKTQYYGGQFMQQPPMGNGVSCQCGFMNKENAKFCAKCGQPLS